MPSPTMRLNEPETGATGDAATLDHLLVEAAIQCPEADALTGDFGSLSYADLLIRAQNIAVVLKRQGVGPGHYVGIAMEQSPVIITAIAGVILAGAAYVPMDRNLLQVSVLHRVRASRVSLILCNGSRTSGIDLCEAWKGLGTVLDASRMEQEIMPSSSDLRFGAISADATAVLLIGADRLSGDLDRDPFGVRASHRRIARFVSSTGPSAGLMDFSAGETFLLQPATAARAGLFELWGSLLHGASLALAPERSLAPREFAEWVGRHGVSVLCLPVNRVHEYIDQAPEAFNRLRHLVIESDGRSGAISPQRVEWLQRYYPNLHIVNTYSTPRIAGYATAYRVPSRYTPQAALPIGSPLEGLQASILDRDAQPVRTGEIGELAFSGEDVCDGGSCMTGERARLRADGLLELHGHTEPQLVSDPSYGFGAADVEAMLAGQKKVREAVVIDERDRNGKQQLVAFIAIEPDKQDNGRQSAQEQLESALKLALPSDAIPSELRYVEQLPKDARGRVDRLALEQMWKKDNEQAPNPERYHEKILEQVRSLWLRLLNRSSVGYEEDFFEAGGTQVQMIRMHAELNRKFPGAVTMGELSVLTTIRKIYEHLMTDPEHGGLKGMAKRA